MLLLVIVLLANTGIVITKHRCKMRGEQIFLFAKPTDICCSNLPTSQECSIAPPTCCLEQTKVHKITIDFQFCASFFTIAPPEPYLISIFDNKPIFLAYTPLIFTYPLFPNPPPLPSGKEWLTHISTFLI